MLHAILSIDTADAEYWDRSTTYMSACGVDGQLAASAVELLCGIACPDGRLVHLGKSRRPPTRSADRRVKGQRAR